MMENEASTMPTIPFGEVEVSRLILGANPINGVSHMSRFLSKDMKAYHTPERTIELMNRCQDLGINAFQSGSGDIATIEAFREQGGEMHFISFAREKPEDPDLLDRLVAAGAVGIAHFGETTDALWKEGKIDLVREYCREIRDTGVMVGVGTHVPDVIDHVISEDWDVDFFMGSVYERHRTPEEVKELLGEVVLPEKEIYLESDPARMYGVMRQTDKPCLAFKILAAGRLCERPEQVEEAFESAFRQLKPNDAVIVGMYMKYEDQPAINAELVRQFSHLSGSLGA